MILQQFVESDGKVMPQSVTGLCNFSYKKITKLVKEAQTSKLLPRPKDYPIYGAWNELNTYFEYPKRPRDRPMKVIKKEYWN